MPGRADQSGAALLPRLLADGIVVSDGAVGTMLHAAGVPLDRSLSELNTTAPALVRDLHAAYVAAGARIIQTNTFEANRLRLARFGLGDSVAESNIAAARLAREAVAHARDSSDDQPPVFVAGSIGPATSSSAAPPIPLRARLDAVAEQVGALAGWVDLLVLETFGDVESLLRAVDIAAAESDLPVIAQLTFGDDGRTLRGETPFEAAHLLGDRDVLALGANCTVGPAVLRDVVAELAAGTDRPVSVQPNAGLPQRLGKQFRYAHNTRYFAQAAADFVAAGANVVGGCCGTTPAHVRAIAKAVSSLRPARPPAPVAEPPRRGRIVVTAARPAEPPSEPAVAVAWPQPDRFHVIAGLQTPGDQEVADFVSRAQRLRTAGADLIALREPAPPRTRVNPIAAGLLLRERVGSDVVLPVETADRSLAALQADLLGAHALGLQIVVCRTGAPRVAGDYPDPAVLWDVDSIGLIRTLRGLNEGTDWRGVAMAERTRFSVGASLTTMAADIDYELDRAEAKVRAGAEFLLTDVVYDAEEARTVLQALVERGIDRPVLAAIAPFDDARTLERLSFEMPHLTAPSSALAALRCRNESSDDDTAAAAAVTAAVETIDALADLVAGVVLHVPADRSDHGADLIARVTARGAQP
ncbi:MAG: bifunctional homocysteine S-methyltransferase/methylenetetrahydrofolate reductase [Pseudonocardiaceae bacterium]|nr:bifunctional homocysteine S-methyltransferase/methylenetetrahydrofolate reductase [Pseudonocardiaceae bacterium]